MANTRDVSTNGSHTQNQADQKHRNRIQMAVDTRKAIQYILLFFATADIV